MMFLMDYENRRRIKIWGRARAVENDPALLEKLMPEGYDAKLEQVIDFTVDVWDSNCPQHIPQKLDVADVRAVVGQLQEKIASLEKRTRSPKRPPNDSCRVTSFCTPSSASARHLRDLYVIVIFGYIRDRRA